MSPGPRKAEAWVRQMADHAGDECLAWPFGRRRNGYGSLRFGGTRKSWLAHRVMCEIAHGPPPFAKAVVSHICGKGRDGCVNPKHLEWTTQRENIAMKNVHGTEQIGSRNGVAKVTEEQALMIVSSDRAGRDIANELGISPCTVSAIRVGRNWGWLTGKTPPAYAQERV